MIYTDNLAINSLSLITSLGCNLSCEYCLIAKSAKETHLNLNEYQQKNIQALEDGSFLNNTKLILNKLNQGRSQIESISFWGQEPTLTLEHVTNHLQEWCDAYPNWKEGLFSTNGQAYADKIIDFLIALDKYSYQPIRFSIQFSWDGEFATNNIRKASSDKVKETYTKVISALNDIKFNKLQLTTTTHGVLSFELLNQLDTTDKILDFYNAGGLWLADIINLNRNQSVYIDPNISLAIESPTNANIEDGIKLAEFIKKSFAIPTDKFVNKIAEQMLFCFLGGSTIVPKVCKDLKLKDSHTLFQMITSESPEVRSMAYDMSNSGMFCGNNVGELKIMYDGTLINCQNHIFEKEIDNIPNDNTFENNVKRSLAEHHYFCNPLTDDDNTINKNLDLFYTSKHDSFLFIYQTTLTLMYYLASTNQIPSTYLYDKYKMAKHAYLIGFYNCCGYNNYIKSASLFIRCIDILRVTCNGALDYIEACYDNQLRR